MSDAIVLDVLSSSPVQLDVGDADPIAREEIAALATRVTTVEGDVTALDGRMDAAEGDVTALGTTVDGIDARVEAIEADYVTSEDVMGALGGEAPTLVSGSSRAVLGDAETASWMERTTAADGAALIEAVYGNTVVQDGSLLSVRMEGVETVAADESWSSQRTIPAATYFPGGMRGVGTGDNMVCDELLADTAIHRVYEVVLDGSQSNLQYTVNASGGSSGNMTVVTIMGNSWVSEGLPQPLKAGEYLSRTSVKCDKLPTRSTAYNTWTGKGISGWPDKSAAFILAPTGDNSITTAAELKEWLRQNPLTIHYALATPTTTPIDPPLPLSYLVGAGGTERVMVASGTTSAPPIFVTRYPLDPADLAASIAPVDGPIATTNHQVGDLLMLGFTLCKATQVIVTGETIAIGTNVTKTTVAAELAALSQ